MMRGKSNCLRRRSKSITWCVSSWSISRNHASKMVSILCPYSVYSVLISEILIFHLVLGFDKKHLAYIGFQFNLLAWHFYPRTDYYFEFDWQIFSFFFLWFCYRWIFVWGNQSVASLSASGVWECHPPYPCFESCTVSFLLLLQFQTGKYLTKPLIHHHHHLMMIFAPWW